MDIRERLENIHRVFPLTKPKRSVGSGVDIDKIIPGEEISTQYGTCFRTVEIYPHTHGHGAISLNLMDEVDSRIYGIIGRDRSLSGVDMRNAVYIDTETTGLAGGTGTVPFLVGLGYFSGENFHIEQFFIRDYNEERAMLLLISKKFKDFDAVVSYNGKSYDINILSTRFILSRIDDSVRNLPHLDLLYVCRRLWSRRLANCTLLNIERSILGFNRDEDVPSYLIPGLFFNYLINRDARPMMMIFKHNRQDIVSLALLTALVGKIYQNPLDFLDHPLDLLSIGRSFRSENLPEMASVCFEKAKECCSEKHTAEEILRSLGYTFKHLELWERAVEVWREIISISPDSIFAYEELAKHYEHRLKDYGKALDIVRSALSKIDILEGLYNKNISYEREALKYRLARLMRKLNRRGKKWV